MLVAFFESIKYVGHLFPVALLRVYIGFFYVNQALSRYKGEFLTQPDLADNALHWLPRGIAPNWYKDVIEQIIVPHWQLIAWTITVGELLIGVSFVLGYLVRPFALLGLLLSLNLLWIMGPDMSLLYKTLVAVHVTLGWLGAGRCLGLDYFFFKRRRGVWW